MPDSPDPFPSLAMRLMLAAWLAAPAFGAAQAADSFYTDLDLDIMHESSPPTRRAAVVDLVHVRGSATGRYSWRRATCAWMSISARRTTGFQTFGPFNYVHRWSSGGSRTACRMRRSCASYLESGMGDDDKGQVLLVSKVGYPGEPGCPVGMVDAKTVEQANGVARGMAAMALTFDCEADRPVAIGAPDGYAFTFTGAVAEGHVP